MPPFAAMSGFSWCQAPRKSKAFVTALLLNPTSLGVLAEQGALSKGLIGRSTGFLDEVLEDEQFVGFVLGFLPTFSVDFALEQLGEN